MKRFLCGILTLMICSMAAGCEISEPSDIGTAPVLSESTEPVEAVYSLEEISGSSFNAAFLKEIAKEKDNFVISPLSLKLALNMAALGAGSETEQELLTVFGYSSAEEMISDSRTLISELDRKDGSITINNSVWLSDRDDIRFSKDYKEKTANIFRAELFEKNLSDKKIVKDFNGWIKKNTNGLIPTMISQPFSESTLMVLVNTLYFKNKWEYPFPEADSHDAVFYGVNGERNTIFMNQTGKFEYAEGNRLRSVFLPYEDGSRMKVYLPMDENDTLGDILNELSPAELDRELHPDFETRNVRIFMPRFECDYSGSLRDMLMLLGITDPFDMINADFSGMLDDDSGYPLYISDVIQSANIKCGEKGTEASAATLVQADRGGALAPEDQVYFMANHPFLYVIESPDGEVLFMGVISDF